MGSSQPRWHALDSLRAAMMALGLVLHAANAYWVNDSAMWPYQDPQEHYATDVMSMAIHTFRMPTFFMMAGFFGALLLDRRGLKQMLRNRFARVTIPLLVFLPLLVPMVYVAGAFATERITHGVLESLRLAWAGTMRGEVVLYSTGHLWFLYDLTIFYGVTAVVVLVARRLPSLSPTAHRWFRAAMESPLRVLWLALPTAASLLPMSTATFDTHAGFVPLVRDLVAYGVIYTYGWLLYRERELLPLFERHAWSHVVLGAVAFVGWRSAMEYLPDVRFVCVLLSALATWLWVFAVTGLFLRLLGGASPLGRYLSDASYWVYLVHLPIVLLAAGLIAPWSVGALLKLSVVVLVTSIATVSTYYAFVRSTFIGRLLNGRRYPRSLPPVERGVGEAAHG